MERISSFYSLEHLVTTLDEQGVPEEYICPITQDFMRDPCIAEDGHTYERAAIEEWLGRHGTSPITRDYISAERLMPDATLRKMIDDFLGEKRQLLLSQREREKGSRLSSADPETDGRSAPPAQFLAAPRGGDDDDDGEGDDDDDDDDDDSGHPYYAGGGAKAERAPLMGLSAERGATKRELQQQQQQARSKQMGSAHHPRPTKASRSPHHREDITPASAHGVVSRQVSTSTSSCWMCVLY